MHDNDCHNRLTAGLGEPVGIFVGVVDGALVGSRLGLLVGDLVGCKYLACAYPCYYIVPESWESVWFLTNVCRRLPD